MSVLAAGCCLLLVFHLNISEAEGGMRAPAGLLSVSALSWSGGCGRTAAAQTYRRWEDEAGRPSSAAGAWCERVQWALWPLHRK